MTESGHEALAAWLSEILKLQSPPLATSCGVDNAGAEYASEDIRQFRV